MNARAGLLLSKVRDALEQDALLATAVELPVLDRARLFAARYRAVATASSALPYLGHRLHYDNRLGPLLLPAYLRDVRVLDDVVGLRGLRTVLDVGANIGQFAATVLWRFPHLQVWSFEPNPAARQHLERNAAQSSTWHVVPYGVGERAEELDLFFVPGKSGQGSASAANATAGLLSTNVTSVRVPVRPLADVAADHGVPDEVDLLKVDVEGAEESVLRGLGPLRWRYLLLETSVRREGGLDLDDALDLLEQQRGVRPVVRWAAERRQSASTRDVLLEARQGA